ncbi:MAG TPA: metal-dependent hydrolase [Telluria sp.]|jgi:membrane-bound metal-dependent hydrolase YbcI (DUF457 family)
MSSIVGHASAGVAVYLCRARLTDARAAAGLPLLVLLAIAPDFDYLAYWLFHLDFQPRFTHSLAFCLALSVLAWGLTTPARRAAPAFPGLLACAIGACSHVLLDLLVGVHPVPVLWPLPLPEWSAPFGILPSAGRMRLTNLYFWRNLLIECGVLLPLYALLVALMRDVPVRRLGRHALLLGPLWAAFLVWSLRVHG